VCVVDVGEDAGLKDEKKDEDDDVTDAEAVMSDGKGVCGCCHR